MGYRGTVEGDNLTHSLAPLDTLEGVLLRTRQEGLRLDERVVGAAEDGLRLLQGVNLAGAPPCAHRSTATTNRTRHAKRKCTSRWPSTPSHPPPWHPCGPLQCQKQPRL